jgi:hypothetical protein
MAAESWGRRIVPLALGVGMLAVVLAAALAPNTGAIPAQSSCQYGTCPSSTTPFPWWIVGVIAVIVAAIAIGLLLLTRRRRPPTGTPAAWTPPAGSTGAVEGAATPPAGPSGGTGASPAYLETPEDVGQSLPPVGAAAAAGAAGGAAAGAAASGEEEPDIDSLMAELDKISGEILKRAPKGGQGGSAGAEGEEEAGK